MEDIKIAIKLFYSPLQLAFQLTSFIAIISVHTHIFLRRGRPLQRKQEAHFWRRNIEPTENITEGIDIFKERIHIMAQK